ncbi:MAG: GspE/PulE family protein [Patescibacteria group bacterium]|jgi:type IV pilus assembly protein PilB
MEDEQQRGHLDISSDDTEQRFQEKMGAIDIKQKEQLVALHADELGMSYINLLNFPIEQETLVLVPETLARDLEIMPFLYSGKEIRIGVVDPRKPGLEKALEDIKIQNRGNVQTYLISPHSFAHAIKNYERLPKRKKVIRGVEISSENITKYRTKVPLQDFALRLQNAPITEIFTIILAGAIDVRASDIHIEPGEGDAQIRYRIDGVLKDVATLPKELWPRVLSRLKLLAKLKLNISSRPQDGRITLFLDSDTLDVRVSTLPTQYGETIVMRILLSSAAQLDLEDLGLRGDTFERLKKQIHRPNGLLVTTGPTGSGKTTTLYAALNRINTHETKIVTLEDPIEYKLGDISQSQVDPSKDYTFAKGLRSILRQDPDVIMVGEIRDLETAEIAIQATLTGHLVLSTIHTNSAAAGIPRFIAMGVKPFLLAPALNSIMSQRLVRRVCQECKEEAPLSIEDLRRVEEIFKNLPDNVVGYSISPKTPEPKFYKGKGCDVCGGSGYKGRIGIYELLEMNEEIEEMVSDGHVAESRIHKSAVAHGMITMVQDGLLKALEGITTIEEVFRVAAED